MLNALQKLNLADGNEVMSKNTKLTDSIPAATAKKKDAML